MRKGWLPINGSTVVMTANGTTLGNFVDFTGPGTILRMIGEYIITSTGAITAADAARISVGIALLSSDALAAGSASVPDPGEEPEYPWLYWKDHPMRWAKALSTTISGDSTAAVVRAVYDIRSMRKFKEREGLGFVVQYTDLAGTPPVTLIAGKTRVLVGL